LFWACTEPAVISMTAPTRNAMDASNRDVISRFSLIPGSSPQVV
jgi:hypothetical protein